MLPKCHKKTQKGRKKRLHCFPGFDNLGVNPHLHFKPMKTFTSILAKIAVCSLMIASLVVVGNTYGAAKVWNDTSSDFNAAGSWTGGSPSGNNVARFDAAFGVNQPTLTADIAISGLLFNGAAVSGFNIGGPFTLTLTGDSTSGSSGTSNSSAAAIRGSNTAGTNTVSANILLGSAGGVSSFVQVAGGTLVINGAISASSTASLSLRNASTGGGVIELNGANGHTTGTSIDSASLMVNVGNDSAFGTGTLAVNATSTLAATGGARAIANAITLNGTATIGGSNAMTLNGAVTAAGALTRTLTVNNSATTTLAGNVFLSDVAGTGRTLVINGTGDVVVNGVISDFNGAGGTAGTLSHGGTGTLTLNNANTYSGGTLLSGLNNIANANGAFGTGNVSLTAAAVTLTLQHGAMMKGGRPHAIGGVLNDFIADTATFSIGFMDDVVNLNYAGTETINMLVVQGMEMSPGVYGSGDIPELFGTGTLTVLVPEPSTWAMIVVGAGLLVATQLRRRKAS